MKPAVRNIAIPIEESQICKQFECTKKFLLYTVSEEKCCILESHILNFDPNTTIGGLTDLLSSHQVCLLLVQRIFQNTIKSLNNQKINVFVGVEAKQPQELIVDYLDRVLETDSSMCCY